MLADKVCAVLGVQASASVVVGMDADDPATAIFSEMIHRHSSCHHVKCVIFHANDLCRARQEALGLIGATFEASKDRYTPLCWIWGQLAQAAMQHYQPEALLLLGDDVEVAPVTRVQMVLGKAFRSADHTLLAHPTVFP